MAASATASDAARAHRASWAGSTSACRSMSSSRPAHRLLRAEEFQLLVLLRRAVAGGAGAAAGHRHLPHHALQGGRGRPPSTRSNTSCARCHSAGCIRYLHSTGASVFFIVVYLHMFRAFLYGSYKAPRELLWLFGMVVYLALMAEAFMGYVLPWGNMSFWGAQVIVNLFGTIPVDRAGAGGVDPRRLRHRRCHAEPLLLAARGGGAAGAAAAGGAAPGGAAPERAPTIPDGIEIKEKKGAGRQAAGWHSVPSVLHGEGPGRRRRVPDRCSRSWCSSCRPSAACSSRRRTSSRRIRCRRPSTSRRCGTSRRSTRSCARCPTSGWVRC